MTASSRSHLLVALVLFVSAFGFLLWLNSMRSQHVRYVSAQGNVSEPQATPLGGIGNTSSLQQRGNTAIVPEHLAESFHWLAQTQELAASNSWRLRAVNYENAPFGRPVYSTSPYRWWLLLMAKADAAVTGLSPARAVEHAALYADPLLQWLFILGTTLLLLWRLGAFTALLSGALLATLFPFASEFIAGAPDDRGLAHAVAFVSLLSLLLGVHGDQADAARARKRWFFLAGVAGGFGLWVTVTPQLAVLLGIGAGGLVAAWFGRSAADRKEPAESSLLPWRTWSAGGALAIVFAYLAEFAPDRLLSWDLSNIHPLYALAWLGFGEVLARLSQLLHTGKLARSPRDLALLALALFSLATVPVCIWKFSPRSLFAADVASLRLTKLTDGAVATNLWTWLAREGLSLQIVATLVLLIPLVVTFWILFREKTSSTTRVTVALATGPLLVVLVVACQHLAWWNLVGALSIATLAVAVMDEKTFSRNASLGLAALLVVPGVVQVFPKLNEVSRNEFSEAEVYGLVERDLAHWIALHTDAAKAVLIAPPLQSNALCYYGGLRGLGGVSWENRDGVAATVRILSAPSFQEAEELVQRREATHLVVLSWDTYFDEFARAGTGQMEGSLLESVRAWKLPLWLRPLSYQLPKIAGFEGQSVTLFEVVENQSEANAQSRLVEYFLESGDLERAATTTEAMRRFTSDLGAWVARAEVDLARNDEAAFGKSLKWLQARLASKTPPALAWDLRVSLAYVLAKAKQEKLCHDQVTTCLASVDEQKLRFLSPESLFRFMVMKKSFGLRMAPPLEDLALTLLAPELRDRFK